MASLGLRSVKLLPNAARILTRSTASYSIRSNALGKLRHTPRSVLGLPQLRCVSSTVTGSLQQQHLDTEASSGHSTALPLEGLPQQVRSDGEFRVVLRRLDDMVRRTGRITKAQLLLVLDEVCKLGAAKPNQALLLIRSCGSLLPEVPLEERTAMVTSIWDQLKQLGTTFDVTHYNALLRVYLQNEHTFSPTEFLAQMEASGQEANRITYQRLISAYCLQGDIQGATKILEFMKSKDLPVTEGIFNSLITGHGRAGDLESAKNIVDVMRTVGLEASSDTYTALMCAYAEKGDIDSIMQLSAELSADSQELAGRCYLSVAYSLATSGHSQHLSKILDKVQINAGYIPDAINLTLSLMTKGEHEAAFEIVRMFQGIRQSESYADGEVQNQGNFFIDHAVHIQMPHEALFGYLDELISSGLHVAPYIIALHSALRKAKENGDYAFGIMRKMAEKDIPLRAHFFWPLFARDSATGNKEGVMKTMKTMTDLGVKANTDTFTKYVFPVLGSTLEDIRTTMQDLGIVADKALVTALARNEVKHQRLDNLVELIHEYEDLVDIPLVRAGLVSCFSRNPQVEAMVKICRHLVDNHEAVGESAFTKEDYLGSFLYDLVTGVPKKNAMDYKPHLHLLFTSLANEGMRVSGIRYRGIRNQLDRSKLPMLKPVAMKMVDPDEIQGDRAANFDLLPGEDVSVEELENHLVELKEKGGNLRGILRKLIMVYANSNNIERALELKKEFDDAGYEATGAIYASLINMYCRANKFEEALELKTLLTKFDPSFKLDVLKYRFLICHLAREKRLPEALAMLHEIKDLSVETERMEKQTFHMMNDLAQDGLSEEVERILETLVELQLVTPNNNVLGPVVHSYINRNDLDGALASIRDCQAKYGIMPHFQDVLVRLVEQGDTEQLQKAMDFASQQHGDINMLYDLIFAFCSTGKYKEAVKLIETPGMIAKNKRLQWYAEKCIGSGKVEALEQLTAITKDLYACDRDQMHFYLIQLHTRNNDPDKCLQVWTAMQEEGVVPRDRTMRYLANVLRSHNQAIPFEVPQLTSEQLDKNDLNANDKIQRLIRSGNIEESAETIRGALEQKTDVSATNYDSHIFELLKAGRIEDALAMADLAKAAGGYELSTGLTNKLIIEYIKRDDIQSVERVVDQLLDREELPKLSGLRRLAEHYQEDGDLDKLMALKEKYEQKKQMPFPIGKAVLGAYIVKDDISSALSYIEKELAEDPSRSRKIGMRSFFGKLIQRGHPMEEVCAMVDRLCSQEVDGPAWQLLYAHLDQGKVEQAKALIQRYPLIQEKSTGILGYIIEMMDSDDDVVRKIEDILEVTKGQEYLDRAKVYFYLLRAHDSQNDHEAGLKVKERMEAEGLPVSEFMLKRLALLLKKTGQDVPFEEPPNPLAFYREKTRLEMKDNLPEIKVLEEES